MLIACELAPDENEKFGEHETQEFGERSDQGGGDRPSLPWGSPEACTESILQMTVQKCTKNPNGRKSHYSAHLTFCLAMFPLKLPSALRQRNLNTRQSPAILNLCYVIT